MLELNFQFSSSLFFSILQYSNKLHVFYKIALPAYLRVCLSNVDWLELNARPNENESCESSSRDKT